LFKLGFEPLEQREGVGRCPCKASNNVARGEAAGLGGCMTRNLERLI
jgi:hypothetical protein